MKKILSVLLAAITACGVCMFSGCTKSEETVFVPETSVGEFELGEQVSNGISLTATTISPNDYAAYGVSQIAENAFSLTANITPAEIINQVSLNWSVEWALPDSAWASNKTNMFEYVALTSTNRGFSATVACYQAFGERVKITVSVEGQEDLNASIYADYVRRPDDIHVGFDDYGGIRIERSDLEGDSIVSFDASPGATGTYYGNRALIYARTDDSVSVGTAFAPKVKYSVELSETFIAALEEEGFTLESTKRDSTLLDVGEEFDCCINLIGTQYFMSEPEGTMLVNAFLLAQGKEDEVDAEVTLTAELVDMYYAYKSAVAQMYKENLPMAIVTVSLHNDDGSRCYSSYTTKLNYFADDAYENRKFIYLPDFLVESVTIDGDSNIVF